MIVVSIPLNIIRKYITDPPGSRISEREGDQQESLHQWHQKKRILSMTDPPRSRISEREGDQQESLHQCH